MSLVHSDLSPLARSEFILGGQKSGKSRRAEDLAAAWLAGGPERRAVLLATAQAHDAEMQARIARHQRDRAQRVPGLHTVELPANTPLGAALLEADCDGLNTLCIVDCLTLWLTQLLMPADPAHAPLDGAALQAQTQQLLHALAQRQGPLVLVGNEIGLGVIPLGRPVRRFVDALGQLNQAVAAHCARATLMVAGLPVRIKPASTT